MSTSDQGFNYSEGDFIQQFFLHFDERKYRTIEEYVAKDAKGGLDFGWHLRPIRKIRIHYRQPSPPNPFQQIMEHVVDFFNQSGLLEVKNVLSYRANQKGRESVAQEGTPPKVVFRLVLIKIILFDALGLQKNTSGGNYSLTFESGNNLANPVDVITEINNYFNGNNSITNRELLKTLYAESREEGVSNTDAMHHLYDYKTTFFPAGNQNINDFYEYETKYFQELFLRIIQSKGLSDSLQNQEGIEYTLKKYNSILDNNNWTYDGGVDLNKTDLSLNEAMTLRFPTVRDAISKIEGNDNSIRNKAWENFCNIVTLPRYMFVSQDKIAAAVQTCMFTQCNTAVTDPNFHFNIPFEIVCPIKNNSGFFSNFIQHKSVMSMGILLQMACVNVTPKMIKDDQQYIDILSPNERTIVFTTKFFLSQLQNTQGQQHQIKTLIRGLRRQIRNIIGFVYGENIGETYPYLNKYITQLFQTPQISTYALLVSEINALINYILTDYHNSFNTFMIEIQRFYNLMLNSKTRQEYNVAILAYSGEGSGDVTGSFPVNIMYYFLIQDCIKIRCVQPASDSNPRRPLDEIKHILDGGSGITVASLIDSLYGHDFKHTEIQNLGKPIMDVRKMNNQYFENIFSRIPEGQSDPYYTLREMREENANIDNEAESNREGYAIAKVMELNNFGCLFESEGYSEKNPYLHYYLDATPIAGKTESDGNTGAAGVPVYPSTKSTLMIHPMLHYIKTRVMKRLLSANSEVEDEIVDNADYPIDNNQLRIDNNIINDEKLAEEKNYLQTIENVHAEVISINGNLNGYLVDENSVPPSSTEVGEVFDDITKIFHLTHHILEMAPINMNTNEINLNKTAAKLINKYYDIQSNYITYKDGNINSEDITFDPNIFDDAADDAIDAADDAIDAADDAPPPPAVDATTAAPPPPAAAGDDIRIVAEGLVISESKSLSQEIVTILGDIHTQTRNVMEEEDLVEMSNPPGLIKTSSKRSSNELDPESKEQDNDANKKQKSDTSNVGDDSEMGSESQDGDGDNMKIVESPVRRNQANNEGNNAYTSPVSGQKKDDSNTKLNDKLIEVNSKVRNVLSKVILAIDFTNTSRQDFQHLQVDSYRKRGFALTSFVGATDDDYYKIANFYQEHTDGIQVYGAAAQFDGAAPYNLNSDVFYADQCEEVDSLIHEENIGNAFKVVVTDGGGCIYPINRYNTTIETDYDLLSKSQNHEVANTAYKVSPPRDKALDKQTYIMGLIVEPFNKPKAFGKNTLINYIQDVLRVLQGSPKKVILKTYADKLEDNNDNNMIKRISDSLLDQNTLVQFINYVLASDVKVTISSVLSALLKIDNIPAPTKKNKNKKLDIFNKKTQPTIIGTNDNIIQLDDDNDDDINDTLLSKNLKNESTSPYTDRKNPSARRNTSTDNSSGLPNKRHDYGDSRRDIFDQGTLSSSNITGKILVDDDSNPPVTTGNKLNLQSPPKNRTNKNTPPESQDMINFFNNDGSGTPLIKQQYNSNKPYSGGKSKKKRSRKNRNKNKKTQKPRFTRNKSLKIKHKRTKKNLNHKQVPKKIRLSRSNK